MEGKKSPMKKAVRDMLKNNALKSGGVFGVPSNPAERKVAEEYAAKGWTVIRGGWPDFLMYREVNGVPEHLGVEVKSDDDTVRPHQELMHKALPFKCIVERR